MKWSIFVCLLVCLARFCEGGAIRCPPGVSDPSCTEERKEVDTQEASSQATEAQCLAGSEWESNCHYCRCADSGVAECLKQDVCDNGVFAEPVLCKANTTFQRDCNTCVCLENGLGLCTLENCRRSNTLKSTLETLDEDDSEKESTKKSEKTDVVVPTIRSSKNETKKVCEAKRMFVLDCNTCWCNDDGTGYSCTRRTCIPHLPDEEPDFGGIPAQDLRVTEKKCKPDEVFELDCNMCRCNHDGKSYVCTRRACAEFEDKDDKKNITLSRKIRSFTTEMPKTCQPGQEFRMDCNKCLCDNRGHDFSCTRIDCSALNNNHETRSKREVSEPIEMKCSPGSVFDRECNVCRCTEDGDHATCTLHVCKTKEADTHAPGRVGPRVSLQRWGAV
ncbi:uncharacterized protein LOC142982556 isoform X2 [Anticarsia gemmatalis]|uniref:uncharacterized protein LOC142982556 isoform X2 n=1 Tax=Anticarsia gemmatalis TaxID=129554 RepID=UPI003F76358C